VVLGERIVTDLSGDMDFELSSAIAAFEGKNFSRAASLLSPLAEEGSAEAQYRLAIMSQGGLGMVVNELMAYKYMKSAAEAGHAMAQHGLGFMYLEGECVEQNLEKAIEWFRKAAEQGLAGSQTTLAMLYEEGRGVEKDLEEAKRWYKMAWPVFDLPDIDTGKSIY
jgi:uncharacterized protein